MKTSMEDLWNSLRRFGTVAITDLGTHVIVAVHGKAFIVGEDGVTKAMADLRALLEAKPPPQVLRPNGIPSETRFGTI